MNFLFIQQLHQPRLAAKRIVSEERGFGILFVFLAIEWFLTKPLDIASNAMRFSYGLFQGLLLLWNDYFHFALSPALMVFFIATFLHYLSRRKSLARQDIASFAALISYNYFAYILVLSAGYILGKFGLTYPFGFEPYTSAAHSSWLAQTCHVLVYFGPSALLTFFGSRALLNPEENKESQAVESPAPLSLISLVLLLTAFAINGNFIANNWQKVRPPMPGDSLNAIPGKAIDGTLMQRSEIENKVLLLDFWATWCPPCVAAMPHIKALNNELQNQDFVLLSINVEPDNTEEVQDFIRRQELDFPVFIDSGSLQAQYRVETLPTVMIYDKSGVLRHVHSGNTSIRTLKKEIENLLKH
ncbi:MAG: hypothetical protein CMH60_05565 [Myxococcales bacterium]|nr:hypothetical protein [Myxococcales bacterium]